MEEIIKVTGLKKYFKEIKAVDDISFIVEKGELFGFLGVNGAGKSTTINMLCTLFAPTAGEVTICGSRLGREDARIRERIGVVWQNNCLDGKLTVTENLYVRGAMYGKTARELRESISRVCDRLQLSELMSRRYEKLSGGQKRRCEIAAALLNTPEILFLDEPTTGLDPATRKLVWESLDRLRRENGMTIFLTTHYMEEAAKSQHIAILDSGRIKEFGTPFTLKERYAKDKLRLLPREGQYEKVLEIADEMLRAGKTQMRQDEMQMQPNKIRVRQDEMQKQENEAGMQAIAPEAAGVSEQNGGILTVTLENSMSALPILKRVEALIDGFELIQGSMDDVFLNVTGKSLEQQ